MNQLRADLETILAPGMAAEPLDHSRQVAAIAAILHVAFENAGLRATLVGGSAIEIHAPGIYKSGDMDFVIESTKGGVSGIRDRIDEVLSDLGFERAGRHWIRNDLFVEVPGHSLEGTAEAVQVGHFVFRVSTKETVLAHRLAGFKYGRHTSYASQAIDMIAAFGDDLDTTALQVLLEEEDVADAFELLRPLAQSAAPVTEEVLQAVLDQLR